MANLRPYPYFNGAINEFHVRVQFHLQRRPGLAAQARRGGTFYRLNYTYSKSIDDASQLSGASDGGLLAAAQDIQQSPAGSRPFGLGSRPRGDGVVLLAGPDGPRAQRFLRRGAGGLRAGQ